MQIYPPGTCIGQYEIASNPMIGGMGVVYFCLDHENDDRPVALKTFKPEYLPDRAARDRFLREGSAWVQLGRHPHIVRCYAVEYIDPTAFLSLELIAKEQGMDDASLRPRLGAPMPVEQALLFALQIARGMKHATEKIPGFVHRDLKPENVLVGADKLPGTNINRLRITDFGLAAVLDIKNLPAKELEKQQEKDILRGNRLNLFSIGNIVGTPEYMAPEQWEEGVIDCRVDIYALGCILLEMLSGRMSVNASPRVACRELHQGGEALRKVSAVDDVSQDTRSLLEKVLALKPNQRYGNWEELTDAIERSYSKEAGVTAPRITESSELSRKDLAEVGWSYNTIGVAYRDMGKAQESALYFAKALNIGETENVSNLIGAALGNLGLVYANTGNARQSIEYYNQAIKIAKDVGSRQDEGMSFINLGNAFALLGETRRAIEYFEEGLFIAHAIRSQRMEENALGNLGNAHADIGDTNRAISYYEQALAVANEIGDRRGVGASLGNLGNLYLDLGESQRALEYYEKFLQIASEIGDRRGEGAAVGNLGRMYKILGNIKRAIRYYNRALEIYREVGDQRGERIELTKLGNAFSELEDTQEALKYYRQALILSRQNEDLSGIANTSYNLAQFYAKQGDRKQALSFAQEATQILAQIGSPNTQLARDLVVKLQGGVIKSTNPIQETFNAFIHASSVEEMRLAVAKYPFMKEHGFIQGIEQALPTDVVPQSRPAYEARLAWLRQIASE